jgi:2-(1,2-epoxy-1,2-dihydrophenyl)acetyl-CoA isomerase
MSFQFIETKIQNNTGVITLNRPEVYNALNLASKFEIIKAIKEFNRDQNIRSIVITGQGKAFCSGQDLNDRTVKPEAGKKTDIGHTLSTEWNPLINCIKQSEKIVIAAINGVCAGAGLSVALASDFKITIPNNRFICGFAQIGLCPDAGLNHCLVRALGYSKALEFSLSGKPMSSEEMLSYGLINLIDENYLDKAMELSHSINQLAPLAVKITKRNLMKAMDENFDFMLENEIAAQRFLGFTQDYSEGVNAFLEKRKPLFKGI